MSADAPQAQNTEDELMAKAYGGLVDYSNKMEEKAFRLAADALGEKPSVDDLINLANTVEEAINNQVFRFAGKLEILHQKGLSPDIACRKGCAYCCGTQIMATVPEILRLAKWIAENFSAEEVAGLKTRLAEFIPKVQAIKASGEQRPPIDCPILVDNACSAHPSRPIACRAANSVDVEACITARNNWQDESLNIPLVGHPYMGGKAMIKGLRNAMKARGLASPIVEMPIALEIALNNPHAGEQFLAGEPVFEASVIES